MPLVFDILGVSEDFRGKFRAGRNPGRGRRYTLQHTLPLSLAGGGSEHLWGDSPARRLPTFSVFPPPAVRGGLGVPCARTVTDANKPGQRVKVTQQLPRLDRGVLALLCEAHTVDPSRPSPELLKLHTRIAPIKVAIFPLMDKDGMPEVAEKLYDELFAKFGKSGFIDIDAKQNIGKRYARMDEAGCPFCFTIDQETLTAHTVTVRDRETGTQERIGLDKVAGFLGEKPES